MPAIHLKYSKISLIHMQQGRCSGVSHAPIRITMLWPWAIKLPGVLRRGVMTCGRSFQGRVRKRRDGGLYGAACAAVASAVRFVMVMASSVESGWAGGLPENI